MINLEKRVPPFAFVIDTDEYAGNFERDLVAYMTGFYGECEVGEECAQLYEQELGMPGGELVLKVADDHGCQRPASIYPSPSPAHHNCSVATWLTAYPDAETLTLWIRRARKFAADPQACGCHEFVPKFNIIGVRMMTHRVETTGTAVSMSDSS